MSAFKAEATVGMICLGIGAVLLYVSIWVPWSRYRQAGSWVETECSILSSEVRETGGADAPSSYYPVIKYRYRFDGRDFESDRFSFEPVAGGEEKAKQIVAAYPAGLEAVAFVNPQDPAAAVLDRGRYISILGSVIALGFLVFGLALVTYDGDGRQS